MAFHLWKNVLQVGKHITKHGACYVTLCAHHMIRAAEKKTFNYSRFVHLKRLYNHMRWESPLKYDVVTFIVV